MTQSELIRHFQTLTMETDYSALLKKEFGVDAPPAAPKYQMEYLYKYCMQCRSLGEPEKDIIATGMAQVTAFIEKFPWAMLKYSEVVAEQANPTKHKKEFLTPRVVKNVPRTVPDGTIEYYKTKDIFRMYMNGRYVISTKALESLRTIAVKKFGNIEMFGPYTFKNGVATPYNI